MIPNVSLPELMGLRADADKLSAQLGGLERVLLMIEANTAPVDVVYSNSTSVKLESSRIVKSGAGKLYGFSGLNTNAAAQFILGFNRTTIPSNGAIPDFVMTAAASSNFWVSWTPYYRSFTEGWVLTNSSTSSTLTIGAADCWFDAQYL
jgi:hypothetical protein